MRVKAVDPGSTATDLNGNTGSQTVERGTDAIVRLATIGPAGRRLFDRVGDVPW